MFSVTVLIGCVAFTAPQSAATHYRIVHGMVGIVVVHLAQFSLSVLCYSMVAASCGLQTHTLASHPIHTHTCFADSSAVVFFSATSVKKPDHTTLRDVHSWFYESGKKKKKKSSCSWKYGRGAASNQQQAKSQRAPSERVLLTVTRMKRGHEKNNAQAQVRIVHIRVTETLWKVLRRDINDRGEENGVLKTHKWLSKRFGIMSP